jgi:hypothetical protein
MSTKQELYTVYVNAKAELEVALAARKLSDEAAKGLKEEWDKARRETIDLADEMEISEDWTIIVEYEAALEKDSAAMQRWHDATYFADKAATKASLKVHNAHTNYMNA